MKRVLLFLVSMTLCLSPLSAQSSKPARVLSENDVKKFIKDYPQLSREFEKIDSDYSVGVDAEDPDSFLSAVDVLKANAKGKAILAKYGWNDSFWEKLVTIAMAYTAVTFEQGTVESNAEIRNALDEIDANTELSPEQKKQLRESIMSFSSALSGMADQFKETVHESDIGLARKYYNQLKTVFEESSN